MSKKKQSVTDQTKEGILYSTMARFSGTFFQFFGSVALARLLAVEVFGLVQIGMMIIGFATRIGEFGLSMGLIQRKEEVRLEHINTLFWVDFIFKLTIFGVLMALLPYLTTHFNAPQLASIMPAIALYMVLDCFASPGNTLLKRCMDFKQHSQIKVTERFIEIFSSVILAFLNFQVWSLILSKLLAVSISAVLASRAAGWYPSFKIDIKGSKDLFSFGGWVFFRNLLRYLGENVDYYFVGKFLGTQQLGFYTRAFDLMRLPQRRITRAVNSVIFSAFARVQDKPEKVKKGFEKVVLAVSLVTYPILVGVIVVAPEFVFFVYGEKWLPMTLPLQIMCIAGILRSIDPFLNSVITATGYVKHTALRRFVEFILIAVAAYIGVQFGIVGVSIAVVTVSLLVMVLMVNLLKRVSHSGWREYLAPRMPGMGGSLVMAAAMLALRYLFPGTIGPYRLLLFISMVVLGAAVYLGFLWIIRPRRVVALLEEVGGDLQKLKSKAQKKLKGLVGRLQRA